MRNIDNMNFEERLDRLLTSSEPVQYKDWEITKEIKEDKEGPYIEITATNGEDTVVKQAYPDTSVEVNGEDNFTIQVGDAVMLLYTLEPEENQIRDITNENFEERVDALKEANNPVMVNDTVFVSRNIESETGSKTELYMISEVSDYEKYGGVLTDTLSNSSIYFAATLDMEFPPMIDQKNPNDYDAQTKINQLIEGDGIEKGDPIWIASETDTVILAQETGEKGAGLGVIKNLETGESINFFISDRIEDGDIANDGEVSVFIIPGEEQDMDRVVVIEKANLVDLINSPEPIENIKDYPGDRITKDSTLDIVGDAIIREGKTDTELKINDESKTISVDYDRERYMENDEPGAEYTIKEYQDDKFETVEKEYVKYNSRELYELGREDEIDNNWEDEDNIEIEDDDDYDDYEDDWDPVSID